MHKQYKLQYTISLNQGFGSVTFYPVLPDHLDTDPSKILNFNIATDYRIPKLWRYIYLRCADREFLTLNAY